MGPPGVGKTKVAMILAKIWSGLGVVDEIKYVSKETKGPNSADELKKAIDELKNTYIPSKQDSNKNVEDILKGKEDKKITILNDIARNNQDKWKKATYPPDCSARC